jgi:hypothetical protein
MPMWETDFHSPEESLLQIDGLVRMDSQSLRV